MHVRIRDTLPCRNAFYGHDCAEELLVVHPILKDTRELLQVFDPRLQKVAPGLAYPRSSIWRIPGQLLDCTQKAEGGFPFAQNIGVGSVRPCHCGSPYGVAGLGVACRD